MKTDPLRELDGLTGPAKEIIDEGYDLLTILLVTMSLAAVGFLWILVLVAYS